MIASAHSRAAPGPAARFADIILAALVVAVVAMMIVPLPTALLDLLLALNIAIAVVLLMVAIYVPAPLRIATLPTILLITTLFRLGLNVSTTRLILAQADAGDVVRAFGSFVVAGNLVVGITIFLIITLIQYVVIARGSERVAEVAARFTLDAMPGKQLAIDADLRSGLIEPDEARRRRAALDRESQFYGSMDGAMKFVKGDAVAAILITIINVIGGLIIGVGYREMSAADAAGVYSLLSIGDGLVAQIPALVISLAAGLVITRVASEDERAGVNLGQDIVGQVLAEPRAVVVAAVLLAGLAAVPGLPVAPFLALSAGAAALAYALIRRARSARTGDLPGARRDAFAVADAEIAVRGVVPIAVELAGDAARALSLPAAHAELLGALDRARQAVYDRLGVPVPAIEIRTDHARSGMRARIRVDDIALDDIALDDIALADPHDDTPASRAVAESASDAIAARLRRVLCRYADEFIGLQEAAALLDALEQTHPRAVREVVPARVSLPLFADVLRRLVRERISIRDLPAILDALAEWAPRAPEPALLAEYVRAALRRQITAELAVNGVVAVWMLDPMIEDTVRGAVQAGDHGEHLALEPTIARDIAVAVGAAFGDAASDDRADDGPGESADAGAPIVLADMDVRRHVAALLAPSHPGVVVLSPQELLPEVTVRTAGIITV